MKIDIEKIKAKKSINELLEFSIINIDKPAGPASFYVSQFVKKALNLRKTSHLGTLDPAVSGVLPVALSRACRLNDYFMHRNKTYAGIMRIHRDISDEKLGNTVKKYTGKIMQLPPVKSRVKRAVREREVKSFEIIEREGNDVLFVAEVQAGTYIRKLCDDIGKEIGGAHMLELRRIKAGIFSEEHSINLYSFEKAAGEFAKGNEKPLREILIPGEIVSSILPVVLIKSEFVKLALRGSPIHNNFIEECQNLGSIKENEKICIFSDERFIGCYRAVCGSKIFAVPEFVLN
jgi:H/ACA ribonucleoprotein complex subunit 4